MKKLLFILTAVVFIMTSCNQTSDSFKKNSLKKQLSIYQTKNDSLTLALIALEIKFKTLKQKISSEKSNNSSSNEKSKNSKYYTTQDSVKISILRGNSYYLSKSNFNNIVDKHPEFFNDDFPRNPDVLYYGSGEKDQDYVSEIGQDSYYTLYAYFLRQKNGISKYENQRKRLINIYLKINSLFQKLQYGGTYFGHQYARIPAYAEYSVYLYSWDKDDINGTYAIPKLKSLYIESLRQLIMDESKIDFETLGKQKIIRSKKLNEIVDSLDKLITNKFYLRSAQQFQYDYYVYYND
jgi:hypothetical protein